MQRYSYSRSQVLPGNEFREVLPPLVQDLNRTKKRKATATFRSSDRASVEFKCND